MDLAGSLARVPHQSYQLARRWVGAMVRWALDWLPDTSLSVPPWSWFPQIRQFPPPCLPPHHGTMEACSGPGYRYALQDGGGEAGPGARANAVTRRR